MRMTERDLKILTFLHEQGVATSEQLKDLCFPSMNSFYKRMHFLSKSGYVESVKVSEYRLGSKTRFESIYASLNRKHFSVPNLRIFKLGIKFQAGNLINELST